MTDELYDVDLADFVAKRNDLVRRLREAGDRELAAAVAKLRRPTPAAWAVNQLSRRERAPLEALVRLGEQLRNAQAQALAGAAADLLREAARARRDAIATLADSAVALLADRGAGADTHRQEVAATLEAASLDPQSAGAVLEGRLSAALEPPSGFGELDVAVAAPQPEAPPPPESAEPTRSELDDAERDAAEARELAKHLAAEARAAVQEAERRQRQADEAAAEVTKLEQALDEARRPADLATQSASEAASAAKEAEAAAADEAERLRVAEERVRALTTRQAEPR
ncbi:MAG: hypothetical protein LC733_01770 [Actinobacteria bacterium]|nr:hypothetical protein [Actinomycetota bacterium]